MSGADSNGGLERVLATYSATLSRIAASYESRPALREELLQDIAFAIWRALPAFRGDSSERSFVLRIATNRALSHMAARQPEKGAVPFSLMETEMVSDTFFVDPAPRPDEMAARHQGAERLQRAVRLHRGKGLLKQMLGGPT